MNRPVFLSAAEAANLITDGSTLLTTGFSLLGVAEEIYKAIEARFLNTGSPKGLTFVHSAGQTDSSGGMEYLAHRTLIKRVIGSHWGMSPRFLKLISSDEIEAFCIPMGQLIGTYKATASGKPGIVSKVGLGTFVDPLLEGGKINQSAVNSGESFIQRLQIGNEDYLFYHSLEYDFFIGRGTTADEFGNITIEDEAVKLELLSAVQAVKKCGGKVMIQVKHLAKTGSLKPRDIVIPGIFVDVIVISENPEVNHRMTSSYYYDPALSGQLKIPVTPNSVDIAPIRELIGRRAVMEVQPGDIINLGVGIPGDAVGRLIEKMGLSNQVSLTVESGTIGGVPLGGGDFGCAYNALAIIEKPYQFDFYNGIGVDVTFMGAAEIDEQGNVNVSKFGERSVGCGGFIDITQSAKTVVFCGTFTAGGLVVDIHERGLHVVEEGCVTKFVSHVSQITFSGEQALVRGQKVLYITERAVFTLTNRGVELIEVAPGIDLQRDILKQMGFTPLISNELREMDVNLFMEICKSQTKGETVK